MSILGEQSAVEVLGNGCIGYLVDGQLTSSAVRLRDDFGKWIVRDVCAVSNFLDDGFCYGSGFALHVERIELSIGAPVLGRLDDLRRNPRHSCARARPLGMQVVVVLVVSKNELLTFLSDLIAELISMLMLPQKDKGPET